MRETTITRKNIAIVKLVALMTACVIALSALTGCSSPKENAEQTAQETGSGKEGTSTSQGKPDASSDQAAPADQAAPSDKADAAAEETSSLNPLTLQVLKVGKADAMVLTCGDAVMVIDCGEKEDGEEVLDYLAQKGAGKVDIDRKSVV